MGRTEKLLAVLAPICAVPLNVAAVHALPIWNGWVYPEISSQDPFFLN